MSRDEKPPADMEQVLAAFTPEERAILEMVASANGWEWAIKHAQLCFDQARMIGEFPLYTRERAEKRKQKP